MNERIGRQVVHGVHLTMSRLVLKQGAVVPTHHHPNEQITTVVEGRLVFEFPESRQEVVAGESLVIPPGLPHRVDALEDSVAYDVFAPVREDWIRGDDAYLRR